MHFRHDTPGQLLAVGVIILRSPLRSAHDDVTAVTIGFLFPSAPLRARIPAQLGHLAVRFHEHGRGGTVCPQADQKRHCEKRREISP